MKKRIVSMILALSMVLSILPVSAFADAGAGLSSAVAEETNSITYSSEDEHEAVGTNSETKNQVVKIKIGTNGLPKAASGTGWSFDETTGLTITGTGSEDTEYILGGTVSCNVTVKNANSYTVYLLDGTVTGTLLIEADNMYGVCVLGGSYADVELNLGTIDGGTYDKLTENGGNVRGGFFRDISGLSTDTQQQAHQLLLPKNCTLNGQKETKIYIIKKYNYSGNGNDLELAVESDTGCDVWAVASTGGSVMALPAGTQNYAFTYFGSTIATISISDDGKTLSASFNMIPAQNGAPMKLVPMALGATELRFNNEGQPDLTDVTYVDSLDTDAKLHRVYMGNGWGYNCYPKDSSNESTLQILDQGGADFDFSKLSDVPINCYVEITNANITGGEFGKNGRLNITSGKISGGTFHNVSAGINSINGNNAVEITGGTFDSLYCNGSCSIANAVIQSCNFNTYGNNTYTISDTVLGELPDGLQKLLPAGQQLSTLVVRNGGVTAMNGRTLPLSTNTIYLVGAGSAELTLNTDVLSINDAPVENYNANTSADGKVLRITGKNDGAEIFVNKSTDPSDLKPLRITEEGLPDLTGVTGVPVSGEGMTANLYEGLGWKYATKKENGRTRAALYITTPDGNPVDLASGAINPYHKAIAVEQITFANVTVTGIVAEGSVGAENTIIQDGTFQKDVYADDNSTIAGGTFQDVVRAYGTITGGAFNAVVQLNQNSEVTGGVFHDIQLPSYATEKTVIQNAMILGSLKTDGDSKAAVSNTVSCGYIESKYLAAGQQQSKLMITDGTVKTVKGNAVTADAVYLVGNTAVTLTFSTEVTNINGEDVSAYNGAQLSADGKTLTLTAKNDGEPIVVNMATTGKLPFSSLSKSDFTVSGTIIGPQTVTSSKEGVGKLSLVYVRTYDDRVFETYPAGADMYGLYKQRIVAQEGDKYTEGSLDIGEVVRRYQANRADFEYDSKTQTANYTGPMYFDDAPHYSIQYVPEDGSSPSVTKPTKAGTYSVYIVVNDSDHYYGTQYKVDTYTVTDSKKLPFSSLTKDDFVIDWSTLVPGITCKKEGVGKLSLVCVRTDNNAELDHFPSETEYGSYKIYIEATEGERYTAGRVLITEEPVVRKYWPTRENFSLDLKNGTATYTGPKYFGNVLPQADLVYNTTNDLLTATATVPTEAGTYYVWLVVENSQYYSGRNDLLPDDYTITEKLPFEGFTLDDFHSIENEDGTYTMICTKTDGVGKLTAKFECITGVNKGKIFTNHFTYQVPDAYGRYQITITAEEGTKYKAGSIELGEESLRYTPEAKDFTYDATKNTVEYNGTNYYDADPQMTLLYGTDQSETVPTAPGSYDVYVKVTAGKNYIENARADDDYIIYRVGTYVVPEKYTLTVDDKSTEHVAGEELSFTADEKDGYTFTGWKVTGLPADVDTTKATISFTMPANNVTLKAQYTENAPETYELKVTDAQVTLKDGGAVADLTAVPVGTELVATAAEKDGYTFTGWEVTGLPADVDTTKATISFTMPANKVTLKAQYTENAPKTYKLDVSDATVTLKDGSAVADLKAVPVGTELKATADEDTETSVFKNWSCTGLELTEEQSTARVVYFTMPDHDVNLKAEFVTPTNKLEVTDAQVTLKDGGDVADLTAVPVGTELKATAYEDTETSVFKSWSCTGLELTEEQRTARVVYFTMPDHDVNLKAVFVTPTNKLDVSGAQVTLKDGGAVADLTAVPVDTELKATADEDTETSVFKNWSCTGLELTEEQSTAHVLEFKMPAQDVKLTAVFEVPATPDPDPTPDPKPDPDPDPEPTPDPKPDPNPDPDPTPDPKPDPNPDPEPTPDPKPNPNPDPTPAPGGDSDGGGAAIVAVAAVGGAAIGVGAYIAGTTAYLKSVLPEGMAIPANRQQLAVALWTAAGKPATQSTALFNDVAADAAELQAIRWVVDTGLMSAQDGSFKPGSRVGRMEVIRTWKTYQQRG
ncbi:InlB B-repeat-containing protein [Faecalibacterium prausnitzii]|uniref:InlB B-repeat-containing protein n=1 Tax=Faecalibacterium prausnitzii TaxID=853 RepID=UPI003A7F637C